MSIVTSIIGYLLSLAGLGFLAGAVIAYRYQSRQQAERTSAQGEVIALVRRSVKVGRPGVYCPVVQFRTTAGQEVQFESKFGTLPASHEVGQSIDVLYDPVNPKQAEIFSPLSRWTVPLTWAIMGLTVLCMGVFFLAPGLV